MFLPLEKEGEKNLLVSCCSRRQKDFYDDSQGSFNRNKLQNSVSAEDLKVTTESNVEPGDFSQSICQRARSSLFEAGETINTGQRKLIHTLSILIKNRNLGSYSLPAPAPLQHHLVQ